MMSTGPMRLKGQRNQLDIERKFLVGLDFVCAYVYVGEAGVSFRQ